MIQSMSYYLQIVLGASPKSTNSTGQTAGYRPVIYFLRQCKV